jgi:pimeloyl-ACP methyl ester carboxylesterase
MSSMRALHVLFASALATLLTLPVAQAAELPPGVKLLRVNGYDIPNASHGMHRMNPAAFNSAVAQFLSGH